MRRDALLAIGALLAGSTGLNGCATTQQATNKPVEQRGAGVRRLAVEQPAGARRSRKRRSCASQVARLAEQSGARCRTSTAIRCTPTVRRSKACACCARTTGPATCASSSRTPTASMHVKETFPVLGCSFEGVQEDDAHYVPFYVECALPAPADRGKARPAVGQLGASAQGRRGARRSRAWPRRSSASGTRPRPASTAPKAPDTSTRRTVCSASALPRAS